jgi:nucleoside-diphosphate-sugar epimerase|tara:strand:+ start:4208 stop:5179 length:972 start_codon:yes stop_codon:yes gene_type:complete
VKNKHILVSGGAGFIGSHLTRRLVSLGAKVSVIVKYKSIIDNVRLSSVWDNVTVIEADLRNVDSLRQFKKQRYDIIFHLAAYNHVGDSFLHVSEALMSNVIATANLLEFAPEYDRFIYTSSSEVYGYQESVPFQESSIPNPISPYAIGKYSGELYARMKCHQTRQPIICVRPFNTFGPYQSERAVIPELIIKSLRNIPIETTEGTQTREFNYVDNIIDGFLMLPDMEPPPEQVINIGSQQEIRICDLAKKIHELCGSKSELRIGALPNRPTEILRMFAGNTQAVQILKWQPKVSFEEGLKRSIDWFRKYVSTFYTLSSPLNQL